MDHGRGLRCALAERTVPITKRPNMDRESGREGCGLDAIEQADYQTSEGAGRWQCRCTMQPLFSIIIDSPLVVSLYEERNLQPVNRSIGQTIQTADTKWHASCQRGASKHPSTMSFARLSSVLNETAFIYQRERGNVSISISISMFSGNGSWVTAKRGQTARMGSQ